ncbi:TetR family transcriptional regulator [Brevibacterium sp. UMB1308A]|uniref:TetR family transcriptional regulator n=1 Tax=Brevibacterium sp. UMB1308A TaxID=3050608 RepID=UPI00254D3F3B|nr:TetR family transcriptional regulator [Brevibacterium sp. UMB1308A]MDK8347213.1 TetR family transcriptional regulator [Brevibacterium sp. UMB1308B]MDK8714114.1 TetR family transcriptional regulator [Brevibacterium sp. UMB1308A]
MALSTDIITDAALKIASEFGLGDLSMRRLARELDVQPSALYWHVANKQEVFILVARRMSEQVDQACGTPPHTFTQVAVHLRRVLASYRDGAEIFLLAFALKGEEVTPQVLQGAVRATFPEAHQTILERLVSFVVGFVAIEQNRELYGTTGVSSDEDFEAAVQLLVD